MQWRSGEPTRTSRRFFGIGTHLKYSRENVAWPTCLSYTYRYISAVGQHMPSTAAGAVDWAYLSTGPLIVSKPEFANSGLNFVPSLIVQVDAWFKTVEFLNIHRECVLIGFFYHPNVLFEREAHLRLTYSRFSPSAQILSSTNIDIALIGHIVYPNCAGSQKHWIMKLPQSIRDSVFDIKADLFVSQLLFIPRRTHRMVWCLSQY